MLTTRTNAHTRFAGPAPMSFAPLQSAKKISIGDLDWSTDQTPFSPSSHAAAGASGFRGGEGDPMFDRHDAFSKLRYSSSGEGAAYGTGGVVEFGGQDYNGGVGAFVKRL